jgi:hypothetical protein
MSHINCGMGMEFGPVEKTIKGLPVFFAQSPPKGFPPFTFGFQNMAERYNCSAHVSPPPSDLMPQRPERILIIR